MKCINCGIEFEGRIDAKYCSPRCRKEASRKASVVTDNVTLSEPVVTDNFYFTVTDNRTPDDLGYDEASSAFRKVKRLATYWYDVPLGAIPVYEKDWPKMPEYMNGRQYFLWWKNEFRVNDDPKKGEIGIPVIHNPFPEYPNLKYEMGGDSSRRWGA